MQYIAYYRVSTNQQEKSGLGLDAQKAEVNRYLKAGDTIIKEFTEVSSGKNDQRIEIAKVIEYCIKKEATLLIAKLDRLSRNVSFIFQLRDSKVNFVCCDIPDANTSTIGIFATIAQHEREIISKRTKAALAAKKAKGLPLGTPNNLTHLTAHTLRKTFVLRYYELARATEGDYRALNELSKQLHHASTDITRRYIGLEEAVVQNIFDNFG